jgi:hypothetical protein
VGVSCWAARFVVLESDTNRTQIAMSDLIGIDWFLLLGDGECRFDYDPGT